MADNDDRIVMFDEDCQLRIYDPEKFSEAVDLQRCATQFNEKLQQFKDMIQNHMSVVQAQGRKIENEKLRAIGMRNKVEGEAEARKRKARDLQQAIKEKQIELDRYIAEYNSILKLEGEQKQLIDKLSYTSST
uniref:Intraflagellar transport protein 20 homolog n=1 Tax=Eutreptiella gymnastica TaxID=73025 RepID=A0A7S1NAM5_9EUGL